MGILIHYFFKKFRLRSSSEMTCGEWEHYSLSRTKFALRAPSTRASVILVEFESMHTEARLAVVGDLIA